LAARAIEGLEVDDNTMRVIEGEEMAGRRRRKEGKWEKKAFCRHPTRQHSLKYVFGLEKCFW